MNIDKFIEVHLNEGYVLSMFGGVFSLFFIKVQVFSLLYRDMSSIGATLHFISLLLLDKAIIVPDT